jgi:hypothetical protein
MKGNQNTHYETSIKNQPTYLNDGQVSNPSRSKILKYSLQPTLYFFYRETMKKSKFFDFLIPLARFSHNTI